MKNELEAITRKHVKLYDDLVNGAVRVADAKERSNAFGKIVNATKLQMDCAVVAKRIPDLDIPLLNDLNEN